MDLRADIEGIFGSNAFAPASFYAHPGGLRFELSQSGSCVTRFLTALRNAQLVCATVFSDHAPLIVCLRAWGPFEHSQVKRLLYELSNAGVDVPPRRNLWSELGESDDWFDPQTREFCVTLAFQADSTILPNILWCALASDLGIRPNPLCSVYLFNLEDRVMVHPYDDRGLDVVGPGRQLLAKMYLEHNSLLLSFELEEMQATFAAPPNNSFKPNPLRGAA